MAATASNRATATSTWTTNDPYRELELYLEKAHEEIGQVFSELESSSRALQVDVPNVSVRKAAAPPPVPQRRAVRNLAKKPGLRVTEPYTTEENPVGSSFKWGLKDGRQHELVASNTVQDDRGGAAPRPVRRTSCPALKSQQHQPQQQQCLSNATCDESSAVDATRSQRRGKRFLTADLHTDSIGKLKSPYGTPLDSASLNTWTTSLMAELNSVIENELQRLGCGRDQAKFKSASCCCSSSSDDDDDVFASTNSSARTLCAHGSARLESKLSSASDKTWDGTETDSWPLSGPNNMSADKHLTRLCSDTSAKDDHKSRHPCNRVLSDGVQSVEEGVVSETSQHFQQLSADFDETKRKIFNDLHLLETTCRRTHSTESATAPLLSNGASVNHNLVLRPQELQDFLRRVEDSIRTTCLDVTGENKYAPKSAPETMSGQTNEEDSAPLFDATTQTSPTCLSRSSSFLWVSDCNCSVDSGTLVEAGRMSSSSNATSLSVSAPLSISRRSLPATASEAEVQTEVNIDTSLSSLISGSSGLDVMDNIQFTLQITPDSAADVAFDPFDNGAESGIGTGSPPPKERRKKSCCAVDSEVTQAEDDSSDSGSETSSVDLDHNEDDRPKRDKVRRRETWEKLRRRHSCKRVHSRRNKDKETVWIPRDAPVSDPATGAVLSDSTPCTVSGDKVLHKPPASSTQVGSARSKLKPLVFRHVTATSSPSSSNSLEAPLSDRSSQKSPVLRGASPGAIKSALQSVLSIEFANKSNSVPLLQVGTHEKSSKLKPVSATCTPTEPHSAIETSLGASRSHSESAFAELEAAEACRWLRAAGFPQYGQMYEDLQFPVDLGVVQRDHQFLDSDSLQALFRRLSILNRTARLKSDPRPRPQKGDISDDEDQECALSDQWTFQRHSRRWSRIEDLPDISSAMADPSASHPDSPPYPADDCEVAGIDESDRGSDAVILGSFRRSSSERLRYGAKSLLRRMESLRSRSRRRLPRTENRNGIVISEPQIIDVLDMQERVKELNCIQISPSASGTPSSTPSPDMNRSKAPREVHSLSATPSPCSSISQRSFSSSSTTKAKIKGGRRFFRKRNNNSEDAHEPVSDSECSPTYWRKYSDSKDFWNFPDASSPVIDSRQRSAENRSFRERFHLAFKQGLGKLASPLASPEEEDITLGNSLTVPVVIRNNSFTEGHTPCGSYKNEAEFIFADSQESEESLALPQQGKNNFKWHSFKRDVSADELKGPLCLSQLTAGQFALLRKLALLRLTALLERYTSTSKPTWGWDLSKFIKKTKAPDYKGKAAFGVPLWVILQRTGHSLPVPILQALNYLRQSALDQVGVFRKSGVRSRIVRLREMCEAAGESGTVDYTDQQAFDVADMVKQYFRDLPEALLTNKLSETLITIFQAVPAPYRLDALRFAVLLLPDEHRQALETLLQFLIEVASISSVNQMNASNLAVCLAPSLFHLNTATASRSVSASPRRRKTVGVPDPRELSENKAAHECLLQMIQDFDQIFSVSDEMLSQCRFTYMECGVPVSLEDLHTGEYGDWQAFMNGCMVSLVKEVKERPKGWVSLTNSSPNVDIAWKKLDDGHSLRLWKISVEVEAPPSELLTRVLRERTLWDPSVRDWRVVRRLEKRSEIIHYVCSSATPPCSTDFCVLRVWRNDLPRGTCLLVETSIDSDEVPVSPLTTRGVVLVSRYLIEPCGAGKSRLVHLSRVDTRGRSPDWYNKNYGFLCAMGIARIRDSFSHVTEGPESKV